MRKVILVSGYSGSGKDLLADYLVSKHNYIKMSFADKLKRDTAKKYSFDPALTLTQSGKRQLLYTECKYITIRDCLIWEAMNLRKLYGANIFAKHVTDRINTLDQNTNVVISDFRFPNEYHWIKKNIQCDLITIRIDRFDKSPVESETETQLDNFRFDYIISNRVV
jgi:hypothetical protein